jgi:hypothetical protein
MSKRKGKAVQTNWYWSSSTYSGDSSNAWNVNMNDGNANNNDKTNNNYVWPVRGGEWTPHAPYDLAQLRLALFAGLYRSWVRCRRMKRNTMNALRFEFRAELNLLDLADELANRTYQPSRVIRFAVERPKLREIVAADFRDRVVHHYLVERLERIFEPLFIHDSYACRVNKGIHAALTRTRQFIRSGAMNGRRPLYALHLDVSNFFMTINRPILYQIIEQRLVREARKGGPKKHDLPMLAWLTATILSHDPLSCRIDKGDSRLLAAVPSHKSLLHAPHGVGLPIGNLTSQFFANVYLNELDQHCKHTLKCRYYLRYCDDFLILDPSPLHLAELREQIRKFMGERLQLELNERYAAIRPVTDGIDFVGYIIRPDYVLVRRRSINNLRSRLDQFQGDHVTDDKEGLFTIRSGPAAIERLRGVMGSYYGHFSWADTSRLRRSLFRRYPWLNAMFRLDRRVMPRLRKRCRLRNKLNPMM